MTNHPYQNLLTIDQFKEMDQMALIKYLLPS